MSKKLLTSIRKTTVFMILLALLLNCFIFSENADTVFAEEWESLIEAEQLPEDQEDTVEEPVQDTGSAESGSDEMLSAEEEQSTEPDPNEEEVLSAEDEQSAEPTSEGNIVQEEPQEEPHEEKDLFGENAEGEDKEPADIVQDVPAGEDEIDTEELSEDEEELEEAVEALDGQGTEIIILGGDEDNEQLFEEYIKSEVFLLTAATPAYANSRLSGTNAVVYRKLRKFIAEVASGKRTSTVFEIPVDELGFGNTTWTAAELGVDSIYTDEAYRAFLDKISYDSHKVLTALHSDCPYELYWCDKESGVVSGGMQMYSDYDEEKQEDVLGVDGVMRFAFSVDVDYRADGDIYTVDPDAVERAQAAAANAKRIVKKYAGTSDYKKLAAYKKEICSLVSYDYYAAAGWSYDSNPWQLVWVFDNDPDTDVVCEGYAKAFQYLVDLSSFSGDVRSIIVTGTMSGGTGQGGHMWNVVRINGKNYLVDVTNCDEDSIGANDLLFLAGTAEGSFGSGYVFTCHGQKVLYRYDDDTTGYYKKAELTLAAKKYDPATAGSAASSSNSGSGSSAGGSAPVVSYRTHVQTYGWQKYVKNGQLSGTTGQAKRLEAININISNLSYSGGITYRTHVQTYGWQEWKSNGGLAGTSGEAKRLEAIRIKLTGEMADYYDVYYQTHIQHFGWSGWAKNGAACGSEGYAYRLEGIRIRLVEKGKAAPGSTANTFFNKNAGSSSTQPIIKKSGALVGYNTHVQTYGWQNYVYDGKMAGTSGQAKRLEGIHISLVDKPYSGDIVYRTHVQTYGWQGWKKNGQMSGTSGKAKRLEGIQIYLTGEMGKHYDVYYRVHAQTYGWLGYAKNGVMAGTSGLAKRLEGINIVLVPKGGKAPGSTKRPYIIGGGGRLPNNPYKGK